MILSPNKHYKRIGNSRALPPYERRLRTPGYCCGCCLALSIIATMGLGSEGCQAL